MLFAEHRTRDFVTLWLQHAVPNLVVDAAADYPTAAHLLRRRAYHIVMIHASLPPREGGIALMRDIRLGRFSPPAGRTPAGTHLVLTSADALDGLADLCDAQFFETPYEPREIVEFVRGTLGVRGAGECHPFARYLATPLWWQVARSRKGRDRWEEKLGILFRDPAYAEWVAGECDRLVRSGVVDERDLSY